MSFMLLRDNIRFNHTMVDQEKKTQQSLEEKHVFSTALCE